MDDAAMKRFEESGSGELIGGLLRAEIEDLEKRIDATRAALESLPEADTEDRTADLLRLEGEKALKEADLRVAESALEPPLADPQVRGWEVTQGLVEYELVAGKDTLVRVFVVARDLVVQPAVAANLDLPEAFDFGGAYELASRLDYASLEVRAPNGSRFRVPATMSGKFTFPSMSEEDNVNFYIAGDQLSSVGRYEFVARFYRDGQLVGTNGLGTREFLETGDLRLLIKVNTYPMSDAGWDTLLVALGYLQRNLPVRAGVAPMDSDVSAGLRYYIDPRPYDTGWTQQPKWTNARLALAFFNFTQGPFQNSDRAQMVMNVREQQPGQAYSPGSADGSWNGGPGQVCGVQLRKEPPGDDHFASVIGQEVGHNLIPLGSHTLDPVIPTRSAFDLLNRRTVSQARTIMFATIAGDVNANDICFYEPDHWSRMRQNLIALNS